MPLLYFIALIKYIIQTKKSSYSAQAFKMIIRLNWKTWKAYTRKVDKY